MRQCIDSLGNNIYLALRKNECMITADQKIYSVNEYFELEANSPEKLAFDNGIITTVAGGSIIHNELIVNLLYTLKAIALSKKETYKVYGSDIKIRIESGNCFVYPDAVVVCSKPLLYQQRNDVITNPLLIIEVISPTTEVHDRTKKWADYKRIPSLMEYVMVKQDVPELMQYAGKSQNDDWQYNEVTGLDAHLFLHSMQAELPLAQIYQGIL